METSLGKEIINHMSMHIGKPSLEAVVIKRQPFVVESHEMK